MGDNARPQAPGACGRECGPRERRGSPLEEDFSTKQIKGTAVPKLDASLASSNKSETLAAKAAKSLKAAEAASAVANSISKTHMRMTAQAKSSSRYFGVAQ